MDPVSELELTIGSLSYGRAAVARADDGRVVFVEGAAPGDRVRATITREHARHLEAEVAEVLEPGAARVAPPCPIVHECGGCPWQHISEDVQRSAKRQSIIDSFERIAAIPDPPVLEIVASPASYGYRNRLKLRAENGRLGFYRAQTNRLVPVKDCLLGEERVREGLPIAEALVASLSTRVTRAEIASRGDRPGLVLALNADGRLRRSDSLAVRAFVEERRGGFRGVYFHGRGWDRTWGDTTRVYTLPDGPELLLPGASFGQVNTLANELLVADVVAQVNAPAGPRVLELYAGAGNFTLALAHMAGRISAVDSDANAVEAGRMAVKAQGIRNVGFHHARSEQFLAEYDGRAPDVVLVDPPRNGLANVTQAVAAQNAPRIVYVSCNPATLARDAKVLTERGYALVRSRPFDLFPHTFHVESVSTFELT
ncbi:MAG: 23S rRNA (uracil1939-C5)-methyltransferase [Candidatus Binatia bacterium]